MITFNQYDTLRILVDYHLRSDGFIYVGTADLATIEGVRNYEVLEELGFIEQVYKENGRWVEPIVEYGFHSYPHILTPLGIATMIYPGVVLQDAFPY